MAKETYLETKYRYFKVTLGDFNGVGGGGGGDGLAAKNIYCSCIGPEFGSQLSCLVPHNCLMFQGSIASGL